MTWHTSAPAGPAGAERGEHVGERRADLDETRRVAYMALIAGTHRHYELVATVGNALAHHGLQVPFPEAAAHLATVASGDTEGESARWLQEKIDHITAKLDAENERQL